MRFLLCSLALLTAGCGRYSDFVLPAAPAAQPIQSYTFEPEPVPRVTPAPGWTSTDVLNPDLFHGVLIVSGYDGKVWRTGIAGDPHPKLEPDSHTWESSYIAANGASMDALEGFAHLYVAGPRNRPRIGLAHAPDVRGSWSKLPKPVLEPGPYRSWDEYGVADPYVLHIGDWFYLYYLGEDRGWRQRIGVARSRDGRTWQKLRTNPVLDLGDPGAFDENGLGEPAVWQAGGAYWMIYTGRGAREIRKLGLARSRDGVHWEKLPRVFSGTQPWNDKVLCDPFVSPQPDGTVALWFGAGNRPSPDEHLTGSIGHALLKPIH